MWSLPKNLMSPGLYELDWQSQTVDKGVYVGNCRMDCLPLVEELVAYCMRRSSQQGFQLELDRFSAACDQEGTKISSEKIEVLCLYKRSRQCFLQVSGNTLLCWRRSSTLGWYSRVTKVGTKGLIHGCVKQTQFCVNFIAPWTRNGSFQRTQSFQFLNRSSFRSSPVVINLGWRLKIFCQRNILQRWDICEEFSG